VIVVPLHVTVAMLAALAVAAKARTIKTLLNMRPPGL
jgi:hypothetical protein